jgi:predicted O-methyltransferase YrrM
MELLNNTYLQNLTKILKNVGEKIEGNMICDVKPNRWKINKNIKKIKNIQFLSKNKKKIIEIGVNAGHSLLLMILENTNAEYLLFDLNNHKYTEPAINYIKKEFPNISINIIYGNSVETVKKYIIDNPTELNTYDLIHIDGGHTDNIFIEDYENCKKLIKKDSVIIFDDYDHSNIKKFIDDKLNKNEIIKYNDIQLNNNKLHLIYKYL